MRAESEEHHKLMIIGEEYFRFLCAALYRSLMISVMQVCHSLLRRFKAALMPGDRWEGSHIRYSL